jgi:hypothetical protein
MKVVRSALRTGRLHPPGNIPGTYFCWRLSRLQGHSAAGTMKFMKSLNRDLPECSSAQCRRQLRRSNSLLWRPLVLSEYQEYFLGGKGGRCIGLTNLPPSCADCLEIWKSQRPWTLRVCADLQRECFILLAFCNILPVIHPDDKIDVSLTLWTYKWGIKASVKETSYTNMYCVTSTKTITLILTAEKTSKFVALHNL